jgi:predicted HTH transcriptional regulator
MTHRPFEVYATSDWRFLTQPKIEGQWFERKAHLPTQQPANLKEFRYQIARTICGFANSNPDVGGLLVIGIGDGGELRGIDRLGQDYANIILPYSQLLDGPIPEHKLVDCIRDDGLTDHLIFIYTPFLQQRVARTTDGQCHIRRADQTVTLHPEEAQDLAYHKGELHFEDEPAGPLNQQDLDPSIVKEFVEQCVQKKHLRDIPSITDALRLAHLTIQQKDGQTYLTKGGLLVFHKDPLRSIPGAYVRYFRYVGRDDQSPQIRDEQFEGPIPTIIQKLREFLPTQFARFSYRREGSLVTEDEYPQAAWDEAVVNALVHRSYSQQTRPVWIRHFDDRFEVTSPGRYPLGVTPDNLIHTPRNTHLMEALRYLDFVHMAEEGTKTMRRVMLNTGLPTPEWSPPGLDRVTCTLFNNIDERIKARTDLATRARITPTTVVSNIFPLRIRSPFTRDPNAPFAEEVGRPAFGEVRNAFLKALRAAGFRVDSFAGVSAVDFANEYVVPALAGSKAAAIYPGIEFRLLELDRSFYLVLDHTVEIRNRANASRVKRALPWLRLDNHRRCFIRSNAGWVPGYIVEGMDGSYRVELKRDGQTSQETIEAGADIVIPDLSTTELIALLQAEGIQVQLIQEIRKASLVTARDAPRRRLERVREIAEKLAERVFPLVVGPHEIQFSTVPAEINQPPLLMGQKLRDPKAQFDSKGLRQDEDILRGLTTFGSFEKPQTEIPIVVMCPASWVMKMQGFIVRLRQGYQRYRGMETTFGARFGTITTVVSETQEYEAKAVETIAQLPRDSRPAFIVFAPERGISRADYNSAYYRLKRILLEAGYPSQMVDEETLENPEWKDLNFALDVFAKSGFVPWVLSEGMPNADLFIGLSSSIITYKGQRQRVVGYANVFDDFGRWLFYQGASESVPYENRNAMFAELLSKITRDYQAKRRKLQWVHIHHSARLRREDRDEIARGILNEAPGAEISFVYVNEHSNFRLFDESPKGDGAAERGTWVLLSPNSFVIATTGPNPLDQKYLGTPRPLEIRVNRIGAKEMLDLATYAQHILSLTRLNWASTRAFCHSPITIKFANDIAYLMNVFLATGAEFRLHDRLRSTPWFL